MVSLQISGSGAHREAVKIIRVELEGPGVAGTWRPRGRSQQPLGSLPLPCVRLRIPTSQNPQTRHRKYPCHRPGDPSLPGGCLLALATALRPPEDLGGSPGSMGCAVGLQRAGRWHGKALGLGELSLASRVCLTVDRGCLEVLPWFLTRTVSVASSSHQVSILKVPIFTGYMFLV